MRTIIYLVITLSLVVRSSALEAEGGWKSAGFLYLGPGYDPISPKTLDELPSAIKDGVLERIKNRVGPEIFSRLQFTGGQIVDFDALYRANPTAKRMRGEIHKYDLHFRLVCPELGIIRYEAQIKLRADGTIVEEIDLPQFRTHPEKSKLLSFTEVKEIAAQNGIKGPIVKADMGYRKDLDIMYWRLAEIVSEDDLGNEYRVIEISAHENLVLRKFQSKP